MTKRLHVVALVTAAAALLVVPTIGQADPPTNGAHNNHGKRGKSCLDRPTVNKGFVVKGTLVSYTADDPSTPLVDETEVVLKVTGANRHARISEGYTDADPATPGFQFASGTTYTADASSDAFKLQLSGYEGADTPSVDDKVRVIGKVPVIRKKCPGGDGTLASRYGNENIRKVKIIDADLDVVTP